MRKRAARGLFAGAVTAAVVALCPLGAVAQDTAPLPSLEDQLLPPRTAPVRKETPAEPAAAAPPAAQAAAPTPIAQPAPVVPKPLLGAEPSPAKAEAKPEPVVPEAVVEAVPPAPEAVAEPASEPVAEPAHDRPTDSPSTPQAPARADRSQMTIEQAAGLLEERARAAEARSHAGADPGPTRPPSRVVAAAQALADLNERFESFALGAFDDLQNQRMTQPAQILVGAVSALLVLLIGFVIRIARGRGEVQVLSRLSAGDEGHLLDPPVAAQGRHAALAHQESRRRREARRLDAHRAPHGRARDQLPRAAAGHLVRRRRGLRAGGREQRGRLDALRGARGAGGARGRSRASSSTSSRAPARSRCA